MDEVIKENGVIEEIIQKEGKKGTFYKVKIGGRTFNAFDKTDAFSQLSNKEFCLEDIVDFEYSQHQTGDITYKNLLSLTKLGEEAAKKAVKTATESRDKTGSQIVRMNALTNSIGFFQLNKEVVAFNSKANPEDKAVNEELVLKLAERFEAWVKR